MAPVGDHDSGLCMLPMSVRSAGAALRSAGIDHSVMLPVFHDRNVRFRPSGEKSGQWLAPSKLTFVNAPRAMS